jgi:hypothetical protein
MKMKPHAASLLLSRRSGGQRRKWRLLAAIALTALPVLGIGLISITRNGSDIAITFEAEQAVTYRLERKSNLTTAAWASIPGVNDLTAASNGPARITDPGAVALGQAFYRVKVTLCDLGLPSNATNALQYAAAMELCGTTTEAGTGPGVISASFTLASGAGVPDGRSRAIRPSFGNNVPRAGNAMVVLSTGAAAATGQVNPNFVAFQPGLNTGTSSAPPADWLAAHGGTFPNLPGCPAPIGNMAHNPIMLTLRIRVPSDAHSFSLSVKFFSSEYPEYVCSPYNDIFVALLDSTYAGTPANPADKNIATANGGYLLGANLAFNNSTPFFTECLNGQTGCAQGAVAGNTATCVGTAGITGTGMDTVATAFGGYCGNNNRVGGGTDWLAIRGNVVPGEIIVLRLALWDTGDDFYDSVVLLDNFSWFPNTVSPGMSLE